MPFSVTYPTSDFIICPIIPCYAIAMGQIKTVDIARWKFDSCFDYE